MTTFSAADRGISATAAPAVAHLHALGTSTWLDDLSRDRITSGNLADLVTNTGIVGVTTNPAIFAASMTNPHSTAYNQQLAELAAAGRTASDAAFDMAIDDVRAACDILAPVYEASQGVDGRVSIEVDPRFAHDAAATVAQARELWDRVARPNLMVKIPATRECLPAITDTLALGISVNVTLIFSVERYREVIAAYIAGLEKAKEAGLNLATIESVASFFISRVDAAVDAQLEANGSDTALAARGKTALANGYLAYAAFERAFFDANEDTARRFTILQADGAHVQRPLWASTSVKNPAYPATLYVSELAGPHTVNTMPEATLNALVTAADDPENPAAGWSNTLNGQARFAESHLAVLEALGINLAQVLDDLETDGVKKFVVSWEDLLSSIQARLETA